MSLIYRGHTAQPSMTAETTETGMTGTFRGHSFTICKAQQPAQRQAKKLQYRGTIY